MENLSRIAELSRLSTFEPLSSLGGFCMSTSANTLATQQRENAAAAELRDGKTVDADTATCLLKLQIGPVQEFIAQARSTRDLWSGSYLLSWLVAAGIRRLQSHPGVELVFPNPGGQLLLEPESWSSLADHLQLLTPNFTNIFVAMIPGGSGAKAIAEDIRSAINTEWRAICSAVWAEIKGFIDLGPADRFACQVEQSLTISWHVTPLNGLSYAAAYGQNGWQLDSVRQTRDFTAWRTGGTEVGSHCNKDSLSGKEEAVTGGPGFLERLAKTTPRSAYAFLFKHDDWLGAVAVVKRTWHQAYLKPKHGLKTSSRKDLLEFPIRSTRAIAARSGGMDDDENVELAPGEKYFAVLAFDGDQIGKWVSGEFLDGKDNLKSHHAAFSAALSNFALKEVRKVVEEPVQNGYGGFLIYAGGDDVLALLPAERALKCAQELRTAFRTATENIVGHCAVRNTRISPDASVGIAIAHFKAPLQDVVRAAQAAEKRAKHLLGRSAVAVSLFKRSGETIEWGCRWEDGGLELYHAISIALAARQLSAKFPYRVAELLQPYLTEASQLTKESGLADPGDTFDQNLSEVIRNEFATALGRQTPLRGEEKKVLIATMAPRLNTYLENLETRFAESLEKFEKRQAAGQANDWKRPRKSEFMCGSLTNLCQTVAFADRNREDRNQKPLLGAFASTISAEGDPAP